MFRPARAAARRAARAPVARPVAPRARAPEGALAALPDDDGAEGAR